MSRSRKVSLLRCGDEVGRRTESCLLDRLRDVVDVEAFGHDHGACVDVALDQPVPDQERVRRLIELVLAGLECR